MIYQLEQFRIAYTTHRWVRTATSTTLLVYAIALYWLPGGFPPRAWQVLLQVIPTLPRLWALQGIALAFPFAVLLLYSLSLLFLWGALLFTTIKLAQHWWQEQGEQKQRSFASATQQSAWIAQETSRKATATTGGGRERPSVLASLTATSRGGKASSSANGTNQQFTHTSTPIFSQHRAVALSIGGQYRDQRQPPDRSLIEASSLPGGPSSNSIALHIGGETDPGRTRSYTPNEDTILVIEESGMTKGRQFPIALVAVADGMGGHANGQQASQTAISVLRDTLLPALRSSDASDMACIEMLHLGVQRANAAIYKQNQTHFWMGTTLTAALVFGPTAHLVNVGDSRTYLYRPAEGLCRVTRDHSLVEELVAAGLIEPADVYTHPYRNQLTRCLGNEAEVAIDSFTVPLCVGDVLLLCSDGLWEMVRDSDIEHMVAPSPRDAQHLAQLLIQAALNRGGKDNVSVITVELARAD